MTLTLRVTLLVLVGLCSAALAKGLRLPERRSIVLDKAKKIAGLKLPAGTQLDYEKHVDPKAPKKLQAWHIVGITPKIDLTLWGVPFAAGALIETTSPEFAGVLGTLAKDAKIGELSFRGSSEIIFSRRPHAKLHVIVGTLADPAELSGLALPAGANVVFDRHQPGVLSQVDLPEAATIFRGLKAQGRIILFHGILSHLNIAEEGSVDGVRCAPAGDWLFFHPSGTLKSCTLAGSQTIQGLPLEGLIALHDGGKVESGIVASRHKWNKLALPRGTKLTLDAKARIRAIEVAEAEFKTQGVSCYEDATFYEDGRLESCWVVVGQRFAGFVVSRTVYFFRDGKLRAASLDKRKKVHGLTLEPDTEFELYHDGSVKAIYLEDDAPTTFQDGSCGTALYFRADGTFDHCSPPGPERVGLPHPMPPPEE